MEKKQIKDLIKYHMDCIINNHIDYLQRPIFKI